MRDGAVEIKRSKLLLEAEAATLLRRSCTHVKRLRLEGKLGYLRGRPVRIDERHLEIYVAWAKRRRVQRTEELKPKGRKKIERHLRAFEYVSANATPRPFALLTIAEAATKFDRTPLQIRYLCSQGRVPFIPVRPPLIDEPDLAEHFEETHRAATKNPAGGGHCKSEPFAGAKGPQSNALKIADNRH